MVDENNHLKILFTEKSASEKCDLVEGGAKNVDASYEQPQLLSGCMMHPKTTIMDRSVYFLIPLSVHVFNLRVAGVS